MTYEKAFTLATRAATYAQQSEPIRNYRHSAIAICGRERYWGCNSYHTHPLQARFGKNEFSIYLHAEIAAMVRAKWEADALIVIRLGANGEWRNSKPCTGCTKALKNVNEIWYSNSTGNLDKL